MTLGERISKYCKDMGITNQKFAEMCQVSKGYISQLINGKNPKTGKPITPAFERYIKIAEVMGMTVDELFSQIDDVPIALKRQSKETLTHIGDRLLDVDAQKELNAIGESLSKVLPKTPEARIVSGGMDKLPKEQREQILAVVRAMFANNPDLFTEKG